MFAVCLVPWWILNIYRWVRQGRCPSATETCQPCWLISIVLNAQTYCWPESYLTILHFAEYFSLMLSLVTPLKTSRFPVIILSQKSWFTYMVAFISNCFLFIAEYYSIASQFISLVSWTMSSFFVLFCFVLWIKLQWATKKLVSISLENKTQAFHCLSVGILNILLS